MANADIFSEFLEKGEAVLWIGQPGPGGLVSRREQVSLLVSFLAAAAIVGWTWLFWPQISAGGGLWRNALVLATIAATCGAIAGGSAYKELRAISRRRVTVYCLTSDRAIIVEGTRGLKRKRWAWVRLADDTPIAVEERPRGRGHISFGRRYDFDTEEWPLFRGFTFYNIKDAEKVRDLVVRLQDGYHTNRALHVSQPGGVRRSAHDGDNGAAYAS